MMAIRICTIKTINSDTEITCIFVGVHTHIIVLYCYCLNIFIASKKSTVVFDKNEYFNLIYLVFGK